MKARKIVALTVILGVLLVLAGGVGLAVAQGPRLGAAVGTAFTYQGQLSDDGEPAEGTYDFQFELHDHPTSNSQVGSTVYVDDKLVTDGLFTVQLDFGSGAFNGEARYLEIGVRAGDTSCAYTILAPRQELTAAPYATYALGAPWDGLTGVPAATEDVSGTYPVLTVTGLQGRPVSDTVPITGQLLRWNGSAWEPATVAGSGNQPPVAVLQADPAVIMPGETATILSLALSYDPEGGPLTYAFDPTGQRVGTPSSYASAASTVVPSGDYETAGDYLVAGWVKDASGAFGMARALVSVYRFCNTIVDSGGDVGKYASLAVVEGRPAIAYYDGTNYDLKYVRALDAAGSSWGPPLTLDSSGTVGQYTSLAVVDGRPAIAYHDYTNEELKYVRASDAPGSYWDTPVTVDSAGYVGRWASLDVVDGRPAIAYFDDTNLHLKYVRAADAAGSSWDTPVTVDSSGEVGMDASLAVVNGHPAIAYYHYTPAFNLKYVRASDASGSSWGTPLTLDSGGYVGTHASLAVVAGRPAIAYRADHPDHDLKYVRANDASGSSWPTPLTVESAGNVGEFASLAVVDGRPAIAYLDNPHDLKYVRASNATGSSWGTPVTADSDLDLGWHVSLAVVDGRPGIAYYDDWVHDDLRFAIPRQE